MSSNNEFDKSNEFGIRGERFLEKFIGQCTGLNVLLITPTHPEPKPEDKGNDKDPGEEKEVGEKKEVDKETYYTEGFDLFVHYLDEENQIKVGTIEVKTFAENKLVSFGSIQNRCIPTIPIEIWGNIANKYSGWFYALTHTKEYNDRHISKTDPYRAYGPGAFIYLICGGDVPQEQQRPFICITFQNAQLFFDRLKQLASNKFGWNVDAWDLPSPENESYWKTLRPQVIVTPSNKIPNRPCNWNVAMSELEDLAYVVTIGEPPTDLDDYQKRRYEYYKKLSNGKHFDVSEWYKMEQLEKAIRDLESDPSQDDNALYEELMEKLEERLKDSNG